MLPENIVNGYGILYEPEPNTGCWLWIGANVKGYAYARIGGQKGYVHRFLWEHKNGPIPSGMFACHKCDTPGCVNPDHIFIGTPIDNMADRNTKKRNAFGDRHGRAKLSSDDVTSIRDMASAGMSYDEISSNYPRVSKSSVYQAAVGRTWKNVDNG